MAVYSFLHHDPLLGEEVFIHTSAQVIGEVKLGDRVSVWPGAVIRGDVNAIEVGEASNIQDMAMLHVTHRGLAGMPGGAATIIGKRVTIGHHAILHGCTIGDESLIGMGSIVLDGAIIESHVMVGAGSLVPPGKRLESGWLYLGSPVKQVRRLTEQEITHFAYSAVHYIRLTRQYRQTI
jgi:carbonic anhydrase/acetyltransferase-like protein (isoleucine patch superfamily)